MSPTLARLSELTMDIRDGRQLLKFGFGSRTVTGSIPLYRSSLLNVGRVLGTTINELRSAFGSVAPHPQPPSPQGSRQPIFQIGSHKYREVRRSPRRMASVMARYRRGDCDYADVGCAYAQLERYLVLSLQRVVKPLISSALKFNNLTTS